MRTIWKYAINAGCSGINVPVGADRLRAGVQNDIIAIWFEIPDTDAPVECREFLVYGTGHEIPQSSSHERIEYFDTVECGPFVWHIYEAV